MDCCCPSEMQCPLLLPLILIFSFFLCPLSSPPLYPLLSLFFPLPCPSPGIQGNAWFLIGPSVGAQFPFNCQRTTVSLPLQSCPSWFISHNDQTEPNTFSGLCFLMSHETERTWKVSPWHTRVPVISWNWLLSKSLSTKPNSTGKAWWSYKLNIFISSKMKFKVAIFLKYFIDVNYRSCPKFYYECDSILLHIGNW